MLTLIDGPAANNTLQCRTRTPILLRVVKDAHGKWDALNELEDEPKPDELVWVYILAEPPGYFHVSRRPRSQSYGGSTSKYKLFPHQPEDAHVRTNPAWREWCRANESIIVPLMPEAMQALWRQKQSTEEPR